MAKPKAPAPPEKKPIGRPTEYDPKYCEMLIEHMGQGGTFKGFAGKLRHTEQTLYNWLKQFPEFLESKKIGECMSEDWYVNMGKMMMAGQIRRVKSERPVLIDGKPMYDKDGKVLMEREYEYTTGGQSTWIFTMKNMHKWRDRVDHNLAGQLPDGDGTPAVPISFDFADMTRERAMERMTELLKKARTPGKPT